MISQKKFILLEQLLNIQEQNRHYFQSSTLYCHLQSKNTGSTEKLAYSLKLLETLIQIIHKQLKNMTLQVICQMILSEQSQSIIVIEKGNIIGGLCFAEISEQYCSELLLMAITNGDQRKGAGKRLLTVFKNLLQSRSHKLIITHADNMAVGFYLKQGFTQEEYVENEYFMKENVSYKNATTLQFKIKPATNYLTIHQKLKEQKSFMKDKIKNMLVSKKIHRIQSNNNQYSCKEGQGNKKEYFLIDPQDVQGLKEKGWSWRQYYQLVAEPQVKNYRYFVRHFNQIYKKAPYPLKQMSQAIKNIQFIHYRNPIDLEAIKNKLDNGQYEKDIDFVLDFNNFLKNTRQLYASSEEILNEINQIEAQMIESLQNKQK